MSVIDAVAVNSAGKVKIDYTNYRGERGFRFIVPMTMYFSCTTFHPERQWLLDAWDCEKETYRTFAVKDIHSWEQVEVKA